MGECACLHSLSTEPMSSIFSRLFFEPESLTGLARLVTLQPKESSCFRLPSFGIMCKSFDVGLGPRIQAQCISFSLGMGSPPGVTFVSPPNQLVETALLGWMPVPSPPSCLRSLLASVGHFPGSNLSTTTEQVHQDSHLHQRLGKVKSHLPSSQNKSTVGL